MIHTAKDLLHGLPAAMAVFGVVLLGGCAGISRETASDKVSSADKAVAVASEGNTRTGMTQNEAPSELKMARDKLIAAKAAQTNMDYAEEARMADEAAADADYARAKATTARTQRAVSDLQQSISMLRKELQSTQ